MKIERLKDLRKSKKLSQKDIGKILNISQQHYSQYELGIRLIPVDKLDILATYYETSVDYILGRTRIKDAYPKK